MTDKLTDATRLKTGDVVTVATKLPDRARPGHTFWWKRFAVVVETPVVKDYFTALTLKVHPDMDRDLRTVDLDQDVVHLLPEDQWPQGVAAMYMKLIHTGKLKLNGGSDDEWLL